MNKLTGLTGVAGALLFFAGDMLFYGHWGSGAKFHDGMLQVLREGSWQRLFVGGLVVYLFSVTALGIMLATLVRSMPQFGLLAFPVFIVMSLLSGGQTPLESMPLPLQKFMQFVPSTHFVSFSQAVLFRNASLVMVRRDLILMFLIGSAYTLFTLSRFRKMLAAIQ